MNLHAAAGAVRVFDLAVALEPTMPRHPAHPPFSMVLTKRHGDFPYPNGITSTSEALMMSGHVGTHVDALGHIAYCGEIHGGHDIMEAHDVTSGLHVGSVEEVPPLMGPGHLVDAEALLGRKLTPADGIGATQLEAWFDGRTAPGPGSVVLIRTGWMNQFWPDSNLYIGLATGLPGLTLDGATWLGERGILAAGSDTMNLEHRDKAVVSLNVHRHFLVERGIYIMETMQLDRLAEAGVTDFTFFAAPLRIRGGSGSPLRPLAVVGRPD
jgi:kynurenine formamidase